MATEPLLSPCPVCGTGELVQVDKWYQCKHCTLTVEKKRPFWSLKGKADRYIIRKLSDDYEIAKQGLLNQPFSLDALNKLQESVYDDETLALFAEGAFDKLHMPSSTLAQILLEQLRETCFLQINDMRRAHGPALGEQSSRFPLGAMPSRDLDWQDDGNLFLTDIRLVFPSNTFTFIRLDRKLIGVWTFSDGLAVQRKGEAFATYFAGCKAHQAALATAYIFGKVPPIRNKATQAMAEATK